MHATDSSAKKLLSTWWLIPGQIPLKYVPPRSIEGRVEYLEQALCDKKYIKMPVPRDVANRHIRVVVNATPNALKKAASQ